MVSCKEQVNSNHDCFASKKVGKSGRCLCKILNNTNFNRDCPFYKTRERFLAENPTSDFFFDEAEDDAE